MCVTLLLKSSNDVDVAVVFAVCSLPFALAVTVTLPMASHRLGISYGYAVLPLTRIVFVYHKEDNQKNHCVVTFGSTQTWLLESANEAGHVVILGCSFLSFRNCDSFIAFFLVLLLLLLPP